MTAIMNGILNMYENIFCETKVLQSLHGAILDYTINYWFQAEAAIVAHVKSTQRIIQFMEDSDKETSPPEPPPPAAPYTSAYPNYYETSPSDVPQDMSLSNLNYSMNYNSSSSSDRMSSSMEVDSYH